MTPNRRRTLVALCSLAALAVAGCTSSAVAPTDSTVPAQPTTARTLRLPATPSVALSATRTRTRARAEAQARSNRLLPGMPAPLSATNVYAADRPGNLSPAVRHARALVYIPNTNSNTVTVIDQRSMRVITTFGVGNEPQHVVPAYNLRTLYIAADHGNVHGGAGTGSLTPINPTTGRPGRPIAVADPYNLYFTPDGRFAIVVAETRRQLEFYDPRTWKLRHALSVPRCSGVDHIDFTADGRTLLASCEFSNQLIAVDIITQRVLRTITLPRPGGMPQDVKLAPDGSVFYVADTTAGGVYLINGAATKVIGFLPTGAGAHGLYVDRSSTRMFVTNRNAGSISVINLHRRRVQAVWTLPGHASPDMGNLSADGKRLWLSGRYSSAVYVIDATNGHLIRTISVGTGPHGLCLWPQPGRYSLGHTGILR
jgi:YVTN family beta-propeller protein